MSSTQSAEQLLQKMMKQYCNLYRPSSVYPDMKKLREVLTQLSDQQKLHLLQQRYSDLTPLAYAAFSDDQEIIRTLLTSLQSSTYRLKLLMMYEHYTPLHTAAFGVHTESVKMILDCLTVDQQIQIMSVQWCDMTAVQWAKINRNTDTVRVLREYQQRANNLMQRRRQQKINDEKKRQRLSGINAQPIIVAVVIYYGIAIIPLQGLHRNISNNVELIFHNSFGC